MANRDGPMGLTPVRHYHGGDARAEEYEIPSAYNTSIFIGDPVKSTGTGRQIALAAAGETMRGVFGGCNYEDAQGNIVYALYWPANTILKAGTTAKALIYDDPDILFKIQTASGTALAQADFGNSADLAVPAGDVNTGRSRAEVDLTTLGTGAGVIIMDYLRRPDNEVGEHADVLVLLNEHELRPGTLTAV